MRPDLEWTTLLSPPGDAGRSSLNACRSDISRMLRLIALTIAILAAFGAASIWIFTAPYRSLNDWNRAVMTKLETVKRHPPPEATMEQWDAILGWTQTAFPNVFYTPDYITDETRFRSFQSDLARRLDTSVDLETIDWIWDEFLVLSKHGKYYADGFRPIEPYGEIHLDESGNPHSNVDVRFPTNSIPNADEP
ncbi:hypothetical protein [Rhodopirellula europaea]|uniref:hypothetical protein n=1 Tax=Rhodopirellula europaea TaxID=1263866 RepID=UPI001181C52E|nr:hypothetical protein [Rhodopirellula europaea]